MKKFFIMVIALPFILFDCSPIFSADGGAIIKKEKTMVLYDYHPWTPSNTLRDKFGR